MVREKAQINIYFYLQPFQFIYLSLLNAMK